VARVVKSTCCCGEGSDNKRLCVQRCGTVESRPDAREQMRRLQQDSHMFSRVCWRPLTTTTAPRRQCFRAPLHCARPQEAWRGLVPSLCPGKTQLNAPSTWTNTEPLTSRLGRDALLLLYSFFRCISPTAHVFSPHHTLTMAAGNFTLLPGQYHPYYPVEAQIAGFIANKWNTLELVSMFAAGCAVIFGITFGLVKRIRPTLSNGDLATIMWFVLCGCIHSFFEGYFAYNFRTMGSMQDLFGQLWKEYSLSDSRYLTQDAFVLCMETVTAVSSTPLCSTPPLLVC
jgi:hypothetical protein